MRNCASNKVLEHALNISKYSKGTALSPHVLFIDVCGVRIVENVRIFMFVLTIDLNGKM